MHSSRLLVVAITITIVAADLNCLVWDVLVLVYGLVCHFKPQLFDAATKASLGALQDVLNATEAIGKFDLEVWPVHLGYEYASIQQSQGSLAAEAYLSQTADDIGHVTLGAVKGTTNQAFTILGFDQWRDVAYCIATGAAVQAQSSRRVKRAQSISDAVKMAKDCTFNPHIASASFNITGQYRSLPGPVTGLLIVFADPKEQVGANIANIASLLVPIGVEAEAGNAASKAFDLVIPGAEDDVRLFKAAEEGSGGSSHFASQEEAQGVADNLQDDDWRKKNCGACDAPGSSSSSLSGGIAGRFRSRVRRRDFLYRRGNVLGACCKVPATLPDLAPEVYDGVESVVESENADLDDVDSIDLDNEFDANAEEAFRPIRIIDSAYVPEDKLAAAPDLKAWDVSGGSADDLSGFQKDLKTHDTASIPWSSKLKDAIPDVGNSESDVKDSESFFKLLRDVFSRDPSDPLYKALKVQAKEGTSRLYSPTSKWGKEDILKPWQAFTDAAIDDAINTVRRVKGIHEGVPLRGRIEYFFVKPSEEALTGVDLRRLRGKGPPTPFHVDSAIMHFSASDKPGLLVKNKQNEAFRLPHSPDRYHAIKGWWWAEGGVDETVHGVYGPEMAKDGRASYVISISNDQGRYV